MYFSPNQVVKGLIINWWCEWNRESRKSAKLCFRTDLQIGVYGTWLKGDDVYHLIMTFVILMCNIICVTTEWQNDCDDLPSLLTPESSRVYTDVVCVFFYYYYYYYFLLLWHIWVVGSSLNMAGYAWWLRLTPSKTISCPTPANGDTCNWIMTDTGGYLGFDGGEGGVSVGHMGSFNTYTLPPLPCMPCFCPSLRTSHSITSLWHTQPQQAIQCFHSSQDHIGHSHSLLQRNALHCNPGHPRSFESIHS